MKLKKWINAIILTTLISATSACSFIDRNEFVDIGMEALEVQDYEAALTAFNSARDTGENMRLIYRGIGLARMGQTRYAEAITAFETALSFSNGIPAPIDYDINYYLAAAFYITGQSEKAIDIYDAILTMRDKDRDAYFLRGAIRVEKGQIAEAREDFDMALSLNSGNSDLLIDIYQILAGSGYHSLGEEYLRNAMDQNPRDMDNFERGRIAFYLGEYEDARSHLEKARDFSFEAILFLGRTYEVLGDFNYAISVYNDYIDRGNESPHVFNQLGICRMHMGDYEGALRAFGSGLQIEENEILQTLLFNEIVAYQFIGDFKKAAVLMEGYLQQFPDDKVAQRENYFLRTR